MPRLRVSTAKLDRSPERWFKDTSGPCSAQRADALNPELANIKSNASNLMTYDAKFIIVVALWMHVL